MDVEKIQKVNNLALNLVKQGLAPDREHAIIQAEKIYQGDNEEYESIKEGLSQEHAKPEVQNVTPELNQLQVKDILEQNSKFLVRKITEFQDKVSSLEKEMQILKSKLAYNSIPSAREILTKEALSSPELTVEQASATVQRNQEQSNVKVESKKTESHPRLGNYSEQDVSVEKFFYMGK